MNQETDTPKQFTAVAGHTHLFRREGGTYYLRVKVPHELRSVIGKTEIRKSLRMKYLKNAVPKVNAEFLAVSRLFAKAEQARGGQHPPSPPISAELLARLTQGYLVEREQKNEEWLDTKAEAMTPARRIDHAFAIKEEIGAIFGHPVFGPDDHEGDYLGYLKKVVPHLRLVDGSDEYRRIMAALRRADSAGLHRLIAALEETKVPSDDFHPLNAHSSLPPIPRGEITLGAYIEEFSEYQRASNSGNTMNSYKVPLRALCEVVGKDAPLHRISRSQIETVMQLLQQVPRSMTQRYKGLSIRRAIEAENRKPKSTKLNPRTIWNYYILLVAFFNYAKEECDYITDNPAKSKKLRAQFRDDRRPRTSGEKTFTSEELKLIFSAPLYTGCEDDLRRYDKPGSHIIRRGRFWVPLIALYHGLRLNEACQLYVQDIKESSGIPYMAIRVDLDDTSETDKHIKNKSSWRDVPIHPELLKMGFLEYVAKRRAEGDEKLFPDLRISKSNQRYSHIFSKWFSQFKAKACGYVPKGNFHGFRKHFATRLVENGVAEAEVERLAGWRSEGMLRTVYLQKELPSLLRAISRLDYPELDLSHLYTSELPPAVAAS